MQNRALIVGIDDYGSSSLTGCVKDAVGLAEALEVNADGSPNFGVRCLTSNDREITTKFLYDQIKELFATPCDTAFFYFAGHGLLEKSMERGFLVTQDAADPNWGIQLNDIVTLANNAHDKIKSTVIMLDSCHSGIAGAEALNGASDVSKIGTGLTILAACRTGEGAGEELHGGGGIFTNLVIDALRGGAADVLGRVTPAAVYAYIDQTLGAWGQRPVYKANVDSFVELRTIPPKVPRETIRQLPKWFEDVGSVYSLDPSYEEDRSGVPTNSKIADPDEKNVRIFKQLQNCNRNGLVVPVDAEHMYYAAINSTGCRLTASGAHFWRLAKKNRI
jgi:hypothetical protein